MAQTINMCYLSAWMTTISIGMFQFGYSIAMFNIFTKILFYQYQKDGKEVIHDQDNFNSLVTTVVPLGAAFGAFTGGFLSSFGRRLAVFILNVIIIAGSSITMIFNFYALLLGRLMLGYGAGAFTVISPLFISETSPEKVAGSMGAINQFMVTAGIMVADILGFIVPYEYKKGVIPDGEKNLNPEVFTTKIWRIVFIIPACLAIFQTLLVLFIFRNDTPKFYKQKRDMEAYERVQELIVNNDSSIINKSNLDVKEEKLEEKVPLSAHCHPLYRYAFIVG